MHYHNSINKEEVTKMKASMITSRRYPLEDFFSESVFVLTDITARRHFENGTATDQIDGYTYLATNAGNYRTVQIFVPDQLPVIEPKQLAELQENGENIFVEFISATVGAYYNRRSGLIEDSIRAESVKIVNEK